ncbi:DUF4083 family protein [Paenibacillus gansuensis]|uniref:DUF4083 family protein n=1 Tax=Paenibacillus gansuensis TaxID=306542 RepID=A0ABW5PAI9_9BACL
MYFINWPAVLFMLIVIGLLVIFAVSFIAFIRKLLGNSTAARHHTIEMNKKLDYLIELAQNKKD